jgi:hypothetical protein
MLTKSEMKMLEARNVSKVGKEIKPMNAYQWKPRRVVWTGVLMLMLLALGAGQSMGSDLDGLFDQNEAERENGWRQALEHKNKPKDKHKEPREEFLHRAPPLTTMLAADENHACTCGVCSHPLQTYFSYLAIWVTDYDWFSPNDKGSFTSMATFARAVGGEDWGDARDVWGVYYACYGYGGPHDEKDSTSHSCGARVHDHVDEEWQLIGWGEASGGAKTETKKTTESSTEQSANANANAQGGASTNAPASGSANGNASGSLSGSRKTHSRSDTQTHAEGKYAFNWKMMNHDCTQKPCHCGTPAPVPTEGTKQPTGGERPKTSTPGSQPKQPDNQPKSVETPRVPAPDEESRRTDKKRQSLGVSFVPSGTYVIQVAESEFTPTNPLASYEIVAEDGERKTAIRGEKVDLRTVAGVLATVGTTVYLISNHRAGNTPVLRPAGTHRNVKVDRPMVFETNARTNTLRLEGVTPQQEKITLPAHELGQTEGAKLFATPQPQEVSPVQLKVIEDGKPVGDVQGYVWVTTAGEKTESRTERPGTKTLTFTRRGTGPTQTVELRSSTPIVSVTGGELLSLSDPTAKVRLPTGKDSKIEVTIQLLPGQKVVVNLFERE